MKILIADDEYLVRSSLKSMLAELALPLELVGEATNGEELIALAEQLQPQIAFVDIRMPLISGLEAIRKGKEVSPHTKWLILTGFSEFDYAQQAIQLGVSDYLLKPVSPEDLQRVMRIFLEENKKQVAAQNQQFERDLMAFQHDFMLADFEDQERFLQTAQFEGALIVFDSHLPEQRKVVRQQKFTQSLRALAQVLYEVHTRFALIVLPSGEMAVVGAWKTTKDAQAGMRVRQYLQYIAQEVQQSSDADFGITFLASQTCPNFLIFNEQLKRLSKLASLRVVCGIGKSIPFKIVEEQSQVPGRMEFSHILLGLVRNYQEKNYLSYCKSLQGLEQFLSRRRGEVGQFLSKAAADFILHSMHCIIPSGKDRAAWLQALQRHGDRILSEVPKDELKSLDLIDQVLTFVDQNYMDDIGIGSISERLSITPNYLSTLFHRKTGTNFMSYLKNVRMLKAKELLNDPHLQIQQVAERVGYASPRHFARLFSEQFGCLPSEYRDRLFSGANEP